MRFNPRLAGHCPPAGRRHCRDIKAMRNLQEGRCRVPQVGAVCGGADEERLGDVQAGVGAEVGDRPARIQQEAVLIELDASTPQRRELPGAEQMRRAAALDPQQLRGRCPARRRRPGIR